MGIGVRLMGGLGNQMFQYAAARALAAQHGTEVVLDLSWYEDEASTGVTPRHYGLDDFAGPAGASRASAPCEQHFHERSFGFDASVSTLPDGITLNGYFQSERYFCDHDAAIREDFRFRAEPDGANRAVLAMIESSTAVAVHVRRGDYATDPATTAHHGLASLDYYAEAARAVAAVVGDPRFFVFSDDPAWCRAHLAFLGNAVVVDHNGPDRAGEDLRLMTACRHHIIANSTFSWWGAWLGRGADQVVVAPRRWFAGAGHETADLCPARWLRR